eukprot:RCo049071
MNSKKVAIGCAAAAGIVVVIGGYLLFKKSKRQDADEVLEFKTKPAPESKAPSSSKATPERRELEALADSLVADVMSSPTLLSKAFPELGVKLQIPEGWDALLDEYSMAGPQIAVIRVVPPGFEQSNPGELPNLSVIVEDVGREQLTLMEYKDKSKEFASNSPSGMMGMMVAPPSITKDEAVSIGRFQHTLEYTQVFPNPTQGYIPYQFMNLMALHGGLAYVVQYMARTDKFSEYLKEATALAASMVIEDLPPKKPSRIDYSSAAHKLTVSVPETWNVVKENKDEGDGKVLVVSFSNGSANKPDTISLYKLSAKASSAAECAAKFCELAGVAPSANTPVDKVAHVTYTVDKKKVSVFATTEYVVTVRPDSSNTHNVAPSVAAAMLNSIKPSEVSRSEIRYVNSEAQFSFELTPTGRVIEHKWGDTTMTYAPVITDEGSEQNVPMFTVAVNKEHEPYANLEQVEAKIMADSDPSTPLRDKKRETFGGREFLTFVISREEGTAGPFGPREEFLSKIMISLRGDESVMLKWEIAANEWNRYERYLKTIVESFQLMQ